MSVVGTPENVDLLSLATTVDRTKTVMPKVMKKI